MKKRIALSVGLGFMLATQVMAQSSNLTILHELDYSASDPVYTNFVSDGTLLYGTASKNSGNNGAVFSMGMNGSGFNVVHSFSGGNNGSQPQAAVTLVGSTLYGTTLLGGQYKKGTIFKVNTDGSGFQILHSFGSGTDGAMPYSSLTLVGSTLYGTTSAGGNLGNGTIFYINTDGSGYGLLHVFTGGNNDGQFPYGSLAYDGSMLYGMTYTGGSAPGTIFKLYPNPGGTGYNVLHNFSPSTDGRNPFGSLVVSNGMLYGMTSGGGQYNVGTLFCISTSGTGFSVLHAFQGAANNNGSMPTGSLTLAGSTLYGMTSQGGANNYGVIFSINTNGSGFNLLHTFNGTDGQTPLGSLALFGSSLYGMTSVGGATGGGTAFSLPTFQNTAKTQKLTFSSSYKEFFSKKDGKKHFNNKFTISSTIEFAEDFDPATIEKHSKFSLLLGGYSFSGKLEDADAKSLKIDKEKGSGSAKFILSAKDEFKDKDVKIGTIELKWKKNRTLSVKITGTPVTDSKTNMLDLSGLTDSKKLESDINMFELAFNDHGAKFAKGTALRFTGKKATNSKGLMSWSAKGKQ